MSSPNKPSPPGASPSVPDVNREYNVYSNSRPVYTQRQMDDAKPGERPKDVKIAPVPGMPQNLPAQIERQNRARYEDWQGRVQTYQQMSEEQRRYRLTPGGYRFLDYPRPNATITADPNALKYLSEYGTSDYTSLLRPNTRGLYSPETQEALWRSTLRGSLQQFTQMYPGIDGPDAAKLYPKHILDDYSVTRSALESPGSLAAATDLAATRQMYDAERRFGRFANGIFPTYTEMLPAEYSGALHMPDWVRLDDGTTYRYMSPVHRLRRIWSDDIVNRMSQSADARETQAANSAINTVWNFAEGSPVGLSARLLDLMALTATGKADGLKMLTGSTMQELQDEYVDAYTRVHGPDSEERAIANFRTISTMGQALGTAASFGLLNTQAGNAILKAGINAAKGAGTAAANATGLTTAAQAGVNAVQRVVQAAHLAQAGQAVANAAQKAGQVLAKIPGATQTGKAVAGTAKAGANLINRVPGQWLNLNIDSLGRSASDAMTAYAEDPTLTPAQRNAFRALALGSLFGGNIFGGKAMDNILFDPIRQGLSGGAAFQKLYQFAQKSPLWLQRQFTGQGLVGKGISAVVKSELSNMSENAVEDYIRNTWYDFRDGSLGQPNGWMADYYRQLADDPFAVGGSQVRQGWETLKVLGKAAMSLDPEARSVIRGADAGVGLRQTREKGIKYVAAALADERGGTAEEHAARLRSGLANGDAESIEFMDNLIGGERTAKVMQEAASKAMAMTPAGVAPAAWLTTADGQMAIRAAAMPELRKLIGAGVPVNYDYLFDNSHGVSSLDERVGLLKDIALARHGVLSDDAGDALLKLKGLSGESQLRTLANLVDRDPITHRAVFSFMRSEAINQGRQAEAGKAEPLGQSVSDADVVHMMQSFSADEREQVAIGFLGQLTSMDQLLDLTEGKELSGAGRFGATALGFYLTHAGQEGRRRLGKELTRLMVNGTPAQIYDRARRIYGRLTDASKEGAKQADEGMRRLVADVLAGADAAQAKAKIDAMELKDMADLNAMVCSPTGQRLLADAGKIKTGNPDTDKRLNALAATLRGAVEARYARAMSESPMEALPLVIGMKTASAGWGGLGKVLSDSTTFYALAGLILTGGVAALMGSDDDDDDSRKDDHDAQAMEKADRQRMLWLRQNDLW